MTEPPATMLTAALPSMLMLSAFTEKAPAAVMVITPPAESERPPPHFVA